MNDPHTLPTLDAGHAPRAEAEPQLDERYLDRGLIGVGGMGEVRRIHDTRLDREVAMKTLHRSADPTQSRFLREAITNASLQHPNIVPIYDMGVHPDGRHWFTMREVRGRTLGEILSDVHAASSQNWGVDRQGWSLRRLVSAVLTAGQAVAYAHAGGILHRDLKPDNVMVGDLGEVYVMDWGIALLTQAEPPSGISGTPSYMAPEQAKGELGDARSDVYGLGAVLYTVLTGSPPYRALSPAEAVALVVRGDRAPLSTDQSPPVPKELIEVTERAMARDPEARFQTALDLCHAIEGWLDDVRQRERALEVVSRALHCVPDAAALRLQAARGLEESARMLERLPSWATEEEKAEAWARDDRARDAEAQAGLLELQVDHGLHAALKISPGLPEAHRALSERHLQRHEVAESNRDAVGMEREDWLLRSHLEALASQDPTRLRCERYLRGDGALTLLTDPPGAEVELHRFELRNRRLVLVFQRSLGTTPLLEEPIPMGSYLCILRAPGRDSVRYPIEVPRLGHWSGVPPSETSPHPIWLPPRGLLDPGEVYVPAGWFRAAGDPEAFRSTEARRLWCDALVIDRFPVTNIQYIQFLDALVAAGREDEALLHAPRERSSSEGLGSLLYGRDEEGRFVLQPDAEGDIAEPLWPVFHLDWHGAEAFLAHRAEQTGKPWRLPGELEWEKAARGVDGRWYPWGDLFDPSFCCSASSHEGRALPRSIPSNPIDESPYGACGMGGNMRDWCADLDGRVEADRVMPPDPLDLVDVEERTVRGGSWFEGSRGSRSANRDRNLTGFRVPLNGVRGLWRPEPPLD